MKAVIPAAGLGTRFLPATKALPKEMVPLVDRPAIQYVVEEAIAAGITEILIITSRWKQAIEDHFDRSLELEFYLKEKEKDEHFKEVLEIGSMSHIHYIRQKVPKGLGDAINHAREFIGGEPFAVMLPDDIIESEKPCIGQLLDMHEKLGAPVLSLERIPDETISRYGVATATQIDDRLYQIHDVVEKPPAEEAPSDLALMGRYILPPEIFDAFDRTGEGHGNEIQLSDAIDAMIEEMDIYGYQFEGRRYDAGTVTGWLEANIEMALKHPQYGPGAREVIKRVNGTL
jgi:UTP--glucose-1-phosphate uridylyltransferase